MKRGIFRIVAGVILCALQILSIIGAGSILPDLGQTGFFTSLTVMIGFYISAICGVPLLIYGIKAYKLALYSNTILHPQHSAKITVIKYICIVAAAISILIDFLLLFRLFSYGMPDAEDLICTISFFIAHLSMLLYLTFYQGKRSSVLFSTSLLFWGIAFLISSISDTLFDIIYLFGSDLITYILLNVIPSILAGILYLILSIKLYRESFGTGCIKTIGITIIALTLVYSIAYPLIAVGSSIGYLITCIITCAINSILPLIIFVYTVIIPPASRSSREVHTLDANGALWIKLLVGILSVAAAFGVTYLLGHFIEKGLPMDMYYAIFYVIFITCGLAIYFACKRINKLVIIKAAKRCNISAAELIKDDIPNEIYEYCNARRTRVDDIKNYLKLYVDEVIITKLAASILFDEFCLPAPAAPSTESVPLDNESAPLKTPDIVCHTDDTTLCDNSETCQICGDEAATEIEPEAAEIENEVAEIENEVVVVPRFCRKCGAKLYDDSNFCTICGTEVIK